MYLKNFRSMYIAPDSGIVSLHWWSLDDIVCIATNYWKLFNLCSSYIFLFKGTYIVQWKVTEIENAINRNVFLWAVVTKNIVKIC